jgi:hypothetical protein
VERALAAPEDDDGSSARFEIELDEGLLRERLAIGFHGQDLLANGVPGDDGPDAPRHALGRLAERERDGPGPVREDAVRETRDRVLLVDHEGPLGSRGGEADRNAHVPAHPDDHVRALHERPARRDGADRRDRRRHRVDRQLALEGTCLDGVEWEAGIGDEPSLLAGRGSGEPHLDAVLVREPARQRECGEHVSRRTAPGDEHPHPAPRRTGGRCDGALGAGARAMFHKIPTAASDTTRDEPP